MKAMAHIISGGFSKPYVCPRVSIVYTNSIKTEKDW